jgi:hypothetical protein
METLKKKLDSGSEIEVFLADFPDGHRLYKAVARELSKYNLAEGTVENLAMVMAASEDVDAALWPCMKKALYTGHGYEKQKLSPEIFEKPEIRSDLIEIQKEVLGYNLVPFSKAIGSLLIATLKRDISSLKSQST